MHVAFRTIVLILSPLTAEVPWFSDCDFDLCDFAQFENCFHSLPDESTPECAAFASSDSGVIDPSSFIRVYEALAGPDNPFDYSPGPLPDQEAAQLALELRSTLKPDVLLYGRISRDLLAIRTQYAKQCAGDGVCLPAIRHQPSALMTELFVWTRADATHDGFRALNCFFGAEVWRAETYDGVTINFLSLPAPINTPHLAALYRGLPEVVRARPGGYLWVNHILVNPHAVPPETYEYTISHGWDDCMLGCIHKTTWGFQVLEEGTTDLIWRMDR